MRRPPAVARVLERLTATAREHELFLPGETVLVAVSGGPDSVCLLESLVRLRRRSRLRLEVVHIDHASRPDSRLDAVYVRGLARRHAVPFHLRSLGERPTAGVSFEAWARDVRRAAFAETARDLGADGIALAHTRDDQAETVLMRLLSGSGTSGVAGMRYRNGPYIRPLLDVGRDEVEAFCRSLGLRPRLDPTNADPTYALRNALRLQGIPALEGALGRGVREPLARAAALLTADDVELTRQMFTVWDQLYDETPEGAALSAVGLLDLSKPVASRLVAQAGFRCGAPVSKADVDAVLDLAAGRPGRRRDLSAGLKARRDREYVRLASPSRNPRAEGSES